MAPSACNLSSTIANNSSKIEDLEANLDTFFMVIMAIIISFMQCGFAFLEAGCVRSKNTTNILLKNLLDTFLGCFVYWGVGYALAEGEGNFFIGYSGWFGTFPAEERVMWFFQFVFAATACTIVSGAVAERCDIIPYFIYSIVITGVVYPLIARWAWHPMGWLADGTSVFEGYKYQDFAGSSVVHLCGGVIALWGAIFCGPRIGRFSDNQPNDIQGHSIPLAALGAFILLFGFFAFNGGSQKTVSKPGDSIIIATAIFNTIIAGTGGAIANLVFTKWGGLIHEKRRGPASARSRWSLLKTINGALVGMVSSSAGCDQLDSWAAFLIGVISSVGYFLTGFIMERSKIDDPLEAVAVHGSGGVIGILLTPLLINTSDRIAKHFLLNLIGMVAIIAWTTVWGLLIFGLLSAFKVLRVSEDMEVKGMDEMKHGEPAYPMAAWRDGWSDFVNWSITANDQNNKARGTVTKLIKSLFCNSGANSDTTSLGLQPPQYSSPISHTQDTENNGSGPVTIAAVSPSDAINEGGKVNISFNNDSESNLDIPSHIGDPKV